MGTTAPVSSYDPERDPVRMAGRVLRWAGPWVVLPAAIGVLVSGNVDLRSIPIVGPERMTAVLLLDGATGRAARGPGSQMIRTTTAATSAAPLLAEAGLILPLRHLL